MLKTPIKISESATSASNDTALDTEVTSETDQLPPYAVILYNDNCNSMDFVISVLAKVFNYTTKKSIQLMFQCHEEGRSMIWFGSKEVAEFKVEQIKSCGGDVQPGSKPCMSLCVSIEPMR